MTDSHFDRRPAPRPTHDAQKTTNRGRFRQGQSGNPGGRPRKSSRDAETSAFEILLGKTLTVTKGGKTFEISMEEALQQRTFQDALAGKRMAVREVIKWLKARAAWFAKLAPPLRQEIPIKSSLDPDNANAALVLLGIATQIPECPEFGDPARLLLEPWAVQLGLRRKRRTGLTERDREAVMRCTRDAEALLRQHDTGR